jgi:hypothetical protein
VWLNSVVNYLRLSVFHVVRGMVNYLRFQGGDTDRMAISHDGTKMRKKRPKKEKSNIICLPPFKNNTASGSTTIVTCVCGGQLFWLREDGVVACHSCRTKQTRVKFRII